jgi:glycosyltransferase involved in cell wall biosynthesis
MLRALASVAAETRRPDEILVVEDGEDPATPGLVRASGIPCRLLQRTLGSVSKARNLGLREALGDWVIYLDDDDVVYPDRCRQLEAGVLGAGGACDLAYGATLKVLPGTRYDVPTHHPEGAGTAGFEDFLRCMPHTNSILFRRQALLDCGGFVEASSYFSDWCALLHMLDQSSGAVRIAGTLAEFRVIPGGMTDAVATDRGMRAKVLEAFDHVRLQREQNRRSLDLVRQAVTLAEPFQDYDSYVELAARTL